MKSVLAIAITWVGYSLIWFGWESIRGSNMGLLDLTVPGHLKSQPGVSSSQPSTDSGGVSSEALQPATPQQLGGPLGAGLFLPTQTLPQQSGGPLGAGLFLPGQP